MARRTYYRAKRGNKNGLDDRYEEGRRKRRRKRSCFNQIATSTNHGPRNALPKITRRGFRKGGIYRQTGKGAKCKRKQSTCLIQFEAEFEADPRPGLTGCRGCQRAVKAKTETQAPHPQTRPHRWHFHRHSPHSGALLAYRTRLALDQFHPNLDQQHRWSC